MKKIYLILTIISISLCSNAQLVEDFESFSLAPDTFDNGADQNGDFIFQDWILNNVYDTAWGGSWTGFAMSNMMDDTTAGWGNQYSAYPGSGNNGSSVYAVGYLTPEISGVDTTSYIDSFKITNTTYAALSMRDGDGFGKQFGSIYNALGVEDSTNGEDYFRVWIIGENYAGTKDSLLFYLADYRFQDSTEDYIVDEWVNVDLTELGIYWPTKITFRFESSDVGQWGINTPVYFAIDDITWSSTQGIAELPQSAFRVYPNPMRDVVHINGSIGGAYEIIDIDGDVILTGEHNGLSHISVDHLPSGMYFLRINTEQGSVVYKLIK